MKLLLATRSAHKAREVAEILAGAGVGAPRMVQSAPRVGALAPRIVTLEEAGVAWSEAEEGLEPHDTFERNAESKARYFAGLTGMATVADDSGLEVDALGGRPGVRTKRFAPAGRYPGLDQDGANNRHLLERLDGVAPARRGARYVCVACLVAPATGLARHFRGEAPGRILDRARGSGGFGYDPLFLDEGTGRSYAELSADEKNARSHRGRAFRALAGHLAREPLTDGVRGAG